VRARQDRYPACVADGQGGAHVLVEEKLFDSESIRFVLGDQVFKPLIELGQTF
jgi:hypothetical protein